MAINKHMHMVPSLVPALIETSGDNFLEELPDWCWAGMPITSDPNQACADMKVDPRRPLGSSAGIFVVLSHIGLPLMSTGTFSHGWGQSGPLRTRGGGVRG